jgi:hypothetical protein
VAPDYWKADPDRLDDIVRIGGALLSRPDAAEGGVSALLNFMQDAVALWVDYFGGRPWRNAAA